MKLVIIWTCCLVIGLLMAFVSGKCQSNSQIQVKTYKIDLDAAPADRFTQVIKDFKQEILALFESERLHFIWENRHICVTFSSN